MRRVIGKVDFWKVPEDIARLKEEDICPDEQRCRQGRIQVGAQLALFLSTTDDGYQLGKVLAENLLRDFELFLRHVRKNLAQYQARELIVFQNALKVIFGELPEIGRHRAGLNFGDCFAYALA
ncbi:MAG: type II toxin-antitoxin system VapC family toxin, partial [Pseudomonadota bacterium]